MDYQPHLRETGGGGKWKQLWGAIEVCSKKIITLLEYELSDWSDITRTYAVCLDTATQRSYEQGRPSIAG